MKPTVHLLATVRKPELLPAALLTFQTLRLGFPTAEVCIWGNNLAKDAAQAMQSCANRVGATFANQANTIHGRWIERLVETQTRPFWICDTDVVFLEEVEHWFSGQDETLFAGRYEPEFLCEWTKAVHLARLHPSLMFINPERLRLAMCRWPAQDSFFGTVERNLFRWQWHARRRENINPDMPAALEFQDTCAGLYHALGGTRFTAEQNACFEHLYCSTYLDLISPHMQAGFEEAHQAIYQDPSLARGIQYKQSEYYASRKPAAVAA